MSALTSLLVVLLFGRKYIAFMRKKQFGQTIREDGPETHLKKKGTPTMGGVLIILGLSVGTLLWADWGNPYVWVLLFVSWTFGSVGFLDDYIKIAKKDPEGLASRWKFRLLVFFALFASLTIYYAQDDWAGQAQTQ
jgi:phospho-N-acetylmuramoyl-pentapeptide-transferase